MQPKVRYEPFNNYGIVYRPRYFTLKLFIMLLVIMILAVVVTLIMQNIENERQSRAAAIACMELGYPGFARIEGKTFCVKRGDQGEEIVLPLPTSTP